MKTPTTTLPVTVPCFACIDGGECYYHATREVVARQARERADRERRRQRFEYEISTKTMVD